MKTITLKANERTCIISKLSNSIPTTYQFSAAPMSNATQLSGTIEVKGSSWIFPKDPTTQSLQADNTVSKTMWDTIYKVYVTSDQDTSISLQSGNMNNPLLYGGLAAAIAVIAASLMMFGLG